MDMSNKIRPNKNLMAVIRDKAKEKTESGLFIPETSNKSVNSGTVVAIGDDLPDFITVGSRVSFAAVARTEIELEGQTLLMLHIDDLYAKIL